MKRIWRILSILFVLGAGAVAVGAMSARELNNKGLEAMERNAFAEAIESFRLAQRILPSDATLRKNEMMAHNAWGVTLGNEGRHEEGERELLIALKAEPENPMVAANLSVLRTNWAMAMMEQAQHETAEKMFYKAYETATGDDFREIDIRRSQNLTAFAQLERKARRDAQALDRLRSALEIDPENVVALLDSADIYYDLGDNLAALDHWTRAEKLKPDIPNLAQRIDKVLRESRTEQNFSVRANTRFAISYETEAARVLAEHTLAVLEEAYNQIGAELKFHPQRRLNVVLYTPEQYKTVTAAPHWAGAVYDGKIRVPIPRKQLDAFELRQLRESLRHEYTHALIHEAAGESIPSWFNEGIAMYFELEPDKRRPQLGEDAQEIWRSLGVRGVVPIMQLPERFTEIEDESSARHAYLLARAFVTWLGEKYRPYRFTAVLESVKSGTELDAAIEAIYGEPTSKLENMFYDEVARAAQP